MEGQLEKLLGDSRSSVAAAVTTLKSAASVVRDNRDQIRRAMEVTFYQQEVCAEYIHASQLLLV